MKAASNIEQFRRPGLIAEYDAVVIGAGPYGLSTAANLRARGLNVAVFGNVLELWRQRMPKGMFLRSHSWATNLHDPQRKYTFERFFEASRYAKRYPLPIQTFVDYALWFQRHAVPEVDETYVALVERIDGHFRLTLEDGRMVRSPTVVMAVGLCYYANRPAEYTHLPAGLVSHSVEHGDFNRFKGKRIVVIGAGQSAIESAALLNEAGASVHVVARRPIVWLTRDRFGERSLIERARAPDSAIAPGWKNWTLEYVPYLFRRFPQPKKDRYIRNYYTAAASDWLRPRVIGKVVLHEGLRIATMEAINGAVEVTLSNGAIVRADHVLMATGYTVDINRLPMLHPKLTAAIDQDMGTPMLNARFESSVPGLYFVGLSSLRCFGPLFRFVAGCKAAGQRVASAVAHRVAAR
ncbi:MAG TPA: NAD(P)-binding domain-containing protein [Burkholderiales bacterium]